MNLPIDLRLFLFLSLISPKMDIFRFELGYLLIYMCWVEIPSRYASPRPHEDPPITDDLVGGTTLGFAFVGFEIVLHDSATGLA